MLISVWFDWLRLVLTNKRELCQKLPYKAFLFIVAIRIAESSFSENRHYFKNKNCWKLSQKLWFSQLNLLIALLKKIIISKIVSFYFIKFSIWTCRQSINITKLFYLLINLKIDLWPSDKSPQVKQIGRTTRQVIQKKITHVVDFVSALYSKLYW